MNHHLRAINGFDQYQMLMGYALSGDPLYLDFNSNRNDPFFNGEVAATVWILLKAGTIGLIEGMNRVHTHACVHSVVQRLQVGSCILESMIGTEAEVFARIYLRASCRRELAEAAIAVQELVVVENLNGESMVLPNIEFWRQETLHNDEG